MKKDFNNINKLALAACICATLSTNLAHASFSGDVFTNKGCQANIINSDGAKVIKNFDNKGGAQIQMGAEKQYYNIQWGNLNVPKATTLDYNFSKNGQVALNQTNGASMTKILGNLTSSGANGRIIIQNPNGILVENGAYINANAVMLTTHDVNINEKEGQFHLSKKTGADGNYHGVVFNKANINLGKDFVIASTGIKIQGADIFAGNNISFITSDGVKFTPHGKGKKSEQEGFSTGSSTAELSIAANQVYYNGKASSEKYNNNILINKGSKKARTAIQMPDGKIHLIADGDDSEITLAYLDHKVNELTQGSDAKKENYLLSSDRGIYAQADNVEISNSTTNARLQINASKDIKITGSSAKSINTDKAPASFYAKGVATDWIELNSNKSAPSIISIADSDVNKIETKINGSTVNIKNSEVSNTIAIDGAEKLTIDKVNKIADADSLHYVNIKNVNIANIKSSDFNTVAMEDNNNIKIASLSSYKLDTKGTTENLSISGASEIKNLNSEAKNVYVNGAKLYKITLDSPQAGGIIKFTKIKPFSDKISINSKGATADSFSFASSENADLNISGINSYKNISISSGGNIEMNKGTTFNSEAGAIGLSSDGDISLAHLNANKITVNGKNIKSQNDSSMITDQKEIKLLASKNLDVHNIYSAKNITATGLESVKIADFTTNYKGSKEGNGKTTLVSNNIENINYDLENSKIVIKTIDKPTTPQEPVEPETPVTPEEPTTPQEPVEPETPVTPEEPTTPQEPVKPETPVTPEEPVTPQEPLEPETPVTPEEPTTPQEPVEPETPVTPEEPVTPQKPVDTQDNFSNNLNPADEVIKIINPITNTMSENMHSINSITDIFRKNLKSFAAPFKKLPFQAIKTKKGFAIIKNNPQ